MSYQKANKNAETMAETVVGSIGVEVPSIPQLKKWTENNFGVPIKVYPRSPELFRGYAGLTYFHPERKVYTVYYNESDNPGRQNFTLCHEIAHIILNSGVGYGLFDGEIYTSDEEERYCNRFAAAFLMPKEAFMQKWQSISHIDIPERKMRMAKIFSVSGEAVRYRLEELGITLDS